MYLSKDRHTMVATIYPPGNATFSSFPPIDQARAALRQATPAGVQSHLTGRDAIFASQGGTSGPGVLTETLIGAVGALIILLFVFGTLPAVAMPLAMAAASILTTFLCVYALTYVTDVSIIVQFLVALVGLGVSIDYALVMIFRFREELASGRDPDDALVETMTHAGRSVIISGSTVAIGLLSMVILPLPFIRSIGIGGMLIPAVAVLASLTLLPALFSLLGHRINRLRVMPKRFVAPPSAESGFWAGWARLVTRRPLPIFLLGAVIVTLVIIPAFHINPSDAELSKEPSAGDARAGQLAVQRAGLPAGVFLPHVILVEHGATPAVLRQTAEDVADSPGIYGAAAPTTWRKGETGLVEAFGTVDGNARSARDTVSNLRHDVLPRAESQAGDGVRLTLGGLPAETRDFIHAVYGKFPYVLLFVLVLTFVLLMRAFRSVRARRQGRVPEPRLARRRVRDRRLHLPGRARERCDLERPGDRCRHLLDTADDLRVPVRDLDGLRGLHAHAHARGVRRDRRHEARDRARARAHREARDERGARAHVRLLLALDEPRPGHQAVRDRAYRPGSSSTRP